MKKVWLYVLLMIANLWIGGQVAHAQIYDADGQYVDTIFHDHINRQAEDFITASLVVADPSNVLYSTLGHACLHVQCPAFEKDFFFSYESEGVRDRIWTFLKGDLKMGMVAWEPEEFLAMYAADGRGVTEYRLNLSPMQEQALWYYLDQRVDEGLNIPYDYFQRGCAKSVVEIVKNALGPHAISYGVWPERFYQKTQRELIADQLTDYPWNEFILHFLGGIEGDADCSLEKKLIIPTDLVEVWQQATIDGHPLLDNEPHVLVETTPEGLTKTTTTTTTKTALAWLTPMLVAILLLLVSWWTPWPMLVVQTLTGLLMCYLIGFSDLPCTTWNWLIIPFNPLPALLWHWRKYWALPYAGVLLIWIIVMCVYPHMLVGYPHVVLTAALVLLLLRQADYSYVKKLINNHNTNKFI